MNKKLTDYVIDLVEILNKQQKQVFWGIFDIFSMVVSIIVSYILFYGLLVLSIDDWFLGVEREH